MRKVLRSVKLKISEHNDLLWVTIFEALALSNGISALQTEGLAQTIHGFSAAFWALVFAVSLELYLE